ncbi:hypothetical protein HDV03_000922 [Kappamyces sp. JEL0829]|nr:hypothetical protein HDV03_000922 [Kappamyces sp. JEL0829]
MRFRLQGCNTKAWFSLQDAKTIQELSTLIQSEFKINSGLELHLDGFLLPKAGLTADLIRDNDLINLIPVETVEAKSAGLKGRMHQHHKAVGTEAVASDAQEPEHSPANHPNKKRQVEERASSSSSSSSSNSNSGSESSSSSSSSESSSKSSTDSDSDSESSTSSDKVTTSIDEVLPVETTGIFHKRQHDAVHGISIPGNLHGRKKDAVRRMLTIPASHYRYEEEEETHTVLKADGSSFKNPPVVFYSEARLYNSLGQDKKQQKKQIDSEPRHSAHDAQPGSGDVSLQQQRSQTKTKGKTEHKPSGDAMDLSAMPVHFNYDALPPAPKVPRAGIVIAFKQLEMSVAFTPEVSRFKVGKILEVKSFLKQHHVQIQLDPSSVLQEPVEPSADWEPKLHSFFKKPQPRFSLLMADDEDMAAAEDSTPESIISVDWDALMERRLVSG